MNQLWLSDTLASNLSITQLATLQCQIIVSQSLHQLQTKLDLLTLSNVKDVQNNNTVRWFLTTSQPPSIKFKAVFIYVPLMPKQPIYPTAHTQPTFYITSLSQIPPIINSTQTQFKTRCKFQSILAKKQQQFKIQSSRQMLQSISNKLLKLVYKLTINQISKWLKFYQKRRYSVMKRVIICWAIYTYSNQLQKQQNEIVSKQYFQTHINKNLLKRVFIGWKNI